MFIYIYLIFYMLEDTVWISFYIHQLVRTCIICWCPLISSPYIHWLAHVLSQYPTTISANQSIYIYICIYIYVLHTCTFIYIYIA